jgi:hypothetical protein
MQIPIKSIRTQFSNDPIRIITNIIALIFSILFALKFINLSDSNVINYYPFITSDGFDWYIEGVYLQYLTNTNNLPPLPVLRPPGFVFLAFIDSMTYPGLIIGSVYGICFGGSYLLALKIIDLIKPYKVSKNLIPPLVFVLLTIHPANYIKKYILSDSIAVTLSLLSIYLLLQYWKNGKINFLILSTGIAVSASVTQTYALLPYLVFSGYLLITSMKQKKSWFEYVIACVLLLITNIVITYFWRLSLPHGMTPTNFELFSFTSDMSSFYVNTWTIYIISIMPLLFASKIKVLSLNGMHLLAPVGVTVLIFATLCFFYQWKEARFTYYFWPWLVISIGTIINADITKKNLICILLCSVSALMISPRNHWVPQLNMLSFMPNSNWLVGFGISKSVNRDILSCISPACENNYFISKSDNYVKSTISLYHMLLSKNISEEVKENQ